MTNLFFSVVIPAYNEALRIGPTLEKVSEYLRSRGYSSELIVVDDGSTDSTSEILQEFSAHNSSLRILRNEPNRGKGFSVRRGVLESNGEYVIFTDADLSAPIEEADKLLESLESSGADTAVGSRAIDRTLIGARQPVYREFGGKVFNLFVRVATGLPIRDTQCGMKLFRRLSTRRAFEMQRVDGFGFDPELLFLIKRFGGKIVEVPVRWNDNPATKIRFFRDSIGMFVGLIALRWRAAMGKYRT